MFIKLILILFGIVFASSNFQSEAFADSDWRDAFPSLYYHDYFEYEYLLNYYVYEADTFVENTLLLFSTAKAFDEWDKLNPKLYFQKLNDQNQAQITIKGVQDIPGDDEIDYHFGGMAYSKYEGPEILDNRQTDILIDMGYYDCKNNFNFLDGNSLDNIIRHEIGHAVGLEHTSDVNHLMFGLPDKVEFFYAFQTYDDLTFVIPSNVSFDDLHISKTKYYDLKKDLAFKKSEHAEFLSNHGNVERTSEGIKYNWNFTKLHHLSSEILDLHNELYLLVRENQNCLNIEN